MLALMPRHVTQITSNVAAVITGPGRLLLEERSVPVPAAGHALVRITSVGICGSDTAYYAGKAKYPIKAPFVMGHEAAGVVESLGSPGAGQDRAGDGPQEQLKVGQRVALIPNEACGHCRECQSGFDNLCSETRYLGSAAVDPHHDGALQRYVVLPVSNLLPLPDSIDDATGALLEPFAVALHAVRKASVSGKTVLIVGGGAIGQLTATAARALGAARITVSDPSARRVKLAVGHGADAGCSPDDLAAELAGGARFDVVFDASGHPAGVELALKAAKPGTGQVVLIGNLPAGYGLPVQAITQAESWVTSTFRFSGGLAPALEVITSAGLDISWLVEESVAFADIEDAFLMSQRADPPLKVQISFPSTPQ